jgi:Protein of unknown function (DUF3455)
MKFTCLFSFSFVTTLATFSLPLALAQTTVPEALQVPADQQLLMEVAATGDQIYVCQAKADQPSTYEWTLKAPEALLYDRQGQTIGHHYGGPTWELNDGSQIVGQLQARADAPDATAIPWLLLQVKSHAGQGEFSAVNWIQRIHTVGGKAPQTGCDMTQQNQEVHVPYSADYYFFGQPE